MLKKFAIAGALALAFLVAPAAAAQWCNSAGVCTSGVVNEDGQGNAGDAQSRAFQDAAPMSIGTSYPAGRAVAANCTAAGTVTLQLATTTFTWPVAVGGNVLPLAATAINSATATCAYSSLK